MNNIKITVITVCYNAQEVIEKTIISTLSQSYDNLEYIIIDGKSEDRTMEIVKPHIEKDARVVAISEPDEGIYSAMNKGIQMATGQFCIFMNAGDCFVDSNVISNMVFYMERYPNNDNFYGNALFVYGARIEKKRDKLNLGMLLNANTICHQVLFSKVELLKKYPLNEAYRICADREWIYKLVKKGYTFRYVDVDICYFDTTGYSLQEKNRKCYMDERFQIQKTYFPLFYKYKYTLKVIREKLLR